MKIGIIREGKVPPDSRVPLTPTQCRHILDNFDVELVVQPSPGRCFPDADYIAQGIPMSEDMESCDVLMGVKEVPIEQLVPNKTCFFFSHTIKEQVYNRPLLKAIIDKNIRLMDYEVLTDDRGKRVIAFGVFAGMVGAHNGIMTYGTRTGDFTLPRMTSFLNYVDAVEHYQTIKFPKMKIVLTGTGRVGQGAAKVLKDMGIRGVDTKSFLENDYDEAVYTQLVCQDYVTRTDGATFDKKDFYAKPKMYKSKFQPFYEKADIMINGIYWDNDAPAFFTVDEMKDDAFNLQVIADVTCDIAPISSIPSTIFASTIADPIFGFDPKTGKECPAFQENSIDMMTVDNLPNELPRDASEAFGQMFLDHVFEELLNIDNSEFMKRASVTMNRDLGPSFEYLRDYLNG